jgi:hypothetical protein
MYNKLYSVLIFALVLSFTGCPGAGSGGTGSTVFSGQGLYIAGQYHNSGNVSKACYWKVDGENIAKQDVPAGGGYSRAAYLAYNGDALYIAGIYEKNGKPTPCYWVDNGATITQHDLGIPSDADTDNWSVQVAGIAAYNGTVYVAGNYHTGKFSSTQKAIYWKESGNPIRLISGVAVSTANGIGIDQNGNVFISGLYYETLTTNEENSYSGISTGCFWKISGSTKTRVILDGYLDAVDGIAVSQDTAYIAGKGTYNDGGTLVSYQPHYISYTTGNAQYAGSFPLVTLSTFISSINFRGITVKNGLVYVGGQYIATGPKDCLWYWDPSADNKEKRIPLTASDAVYVTGIAVDDGGSVFLSGSHKPNTNYTACFWKDGQTTPVTLPDGGYGSRAEDVIFAE